MLESRVAITAKAIPRLAPRVAPITRHITVRGWTFGIGSSKTREAAAAIVILDNTRISLLGDTVGRHKRKNATPTRKALIARLSIGPRVGPCTPDVRTMAWTGRGRS